ncbi:uncharacterized protein LOC126891433 isoform X1 [Diabrotica virgifera virgifera]|uniref:Uncharacterized protein n=1 Tax=Diabrotica virgifera virgifera TaxID=50390 RepID=A0ABM5L2A7_DIAVI|nr:uncharacterized protein LOC126891433 isoform X1 [Diabrotica virgifera virgifera]
MERYGVQTVKYSFVFVKHLWIGMKIVYQTCIVMKPYLTLKALDDPLIPYTVRGHKRIKHSLVTNEEFNYTDQYGSQIWEWDPYHSQHLVWARHNDAVTREYWRLVRQNLNYNLELYKFYRI